MNKKTKLIISLILNILIIGFTAYAMSKFFVTSGEANMTVTGIIHIRYFTNQSNYLVALSAILVCIENIKELKNKEYKQKKWVHNFKFAATISVTVTFLTSLLFLTPTMGMGLAIMWKGNVKFLHTITPIIAILSVIIFENDVEISKKECLYGLLPTIVYSFGYFPYVFISGDDFYGFSFGLKVIPAIISLIVMYAFTYGLCVLERYLRSKGRKEC